MQSEKIIYSAIVRKKHSILTEYTDCSGNFSQIIIGIMDEVINTINMEPAQYKAKFIYGKYIFHVLKDYNIYIITMNKPTKNKTNTDALFFNFLFNIREDISKKKDFDDHFKLRAYSFSYYLPKLKEKVIQFNKNEIKFNDILTDKQNNFDKFELLNDKIFNEYKQFPILSNEQVHADKNIISKEENINDIEDELSDTFDSYNDDILKTSLVERTTTNSLNDDSPVPMKTLKQSEFDLNFREKKRKKLWPKIVFLIIVLIIIILVLLYVLVFKSIF